MNIRVENRSLTSSTKLLVTQSVTQARGDCKLLTTLLVTVYYNLFNGFISAACRRRYDSKRPQTVYENERELEGRLKTENLHDHNIS